MKWYHGSFLSSFIPLIQGSFPSFRPFSPQPLLSQLNIHVLFSPLFLLFPSPLCGCFSSVGFDLFAGNTNIFKSFLICYFCTLFWNEISWKGNLGCPIHCRGKLIVTWVGRLCMQLKPVLGKCWGMVPSTGLCAVSLVYIMKVHPDSAVQLASGLLSHATAEKGKMEGQYLSVFMFLCSGWWPKPWGVWSLVMGTVTQIPGIHWDSSLYQQGHWEVTCVL